MKVAVLADTHTLGRRYRPPAGMWPYIESADHILHAGDVCEPSLLDELKSFAPLTVVHGNSDGWEVRDWGAPETVTIELDGVSIAMIHDSGRREGRRRRLKSRWPSARVVVFGHSHQPINEDDGDLLLFNPGSPTWPRRGPWPSIGLLWIEDGRVEGEVFPV